MPSFSYRWGAPRCREESNERRNCRGRRPGGAVPCGRRLLGWIENVARRSTTWGDVDLAAFCRATGYSREHTTRELSKIRRTRPDLVFETKQRRKRPRAGQPSTWGVIVCETKKLKYDRRSLFYDQTGKRLHNYTTLGFGGKKLVPTCTPFSTSQAPPGSSSERHSPPVSPTKVCDNPYKTEDSFGIQQTDLYGARRVVAQLRDGNRRAERANARSRLSRKAFSLLSRLRECHYDNCKVTFGSRTAYRYAVQALLDGHDQSRIVGCYSDALFVCHGFAVDRGAHIGKVVHFNPSSTVSKARKLLARDGLNRAERVRKWHGSNPRRTDNQPEPFLSPEQIHAEILATFPRD